MVLGQDSTPYYYRKYLWKHLLKKDGLSVVLPPENRVDWSVNAVEKSKLERRIKEVLQK